MKYSNKYDLPEEVYKALVIDKYGHSNDPYRVSATALLKSPKERLLTLRHKSELETDAVDRLWSVFGTACHNIFERQESDGVKERRLSMQVGKMTLSGQTDIYLPDKKIIRDYKVTSAWKFIYKEFDDYEKQLNIYAALHRQAGLEVEGLEIVAILRDFSKRDADKKPDYPQLPIICLPIPLWTYDAQMEYIAGRVALHEDAIDLADDGEALLVAYLWRLAGLAVDFLVIADR